MLSFSFSRSSVWNGALQRDIIPHFLKWKAWSFCILIGVSQHNKGYLPNLKHSRGTKAHIFMQGTTHASDYLHHCSCGYWLLCLWLREWCMCAHAGLSGEIWIPAQGEWVSQHSWSQVCHQVNLWRVSAMLSLSYWAFGYSSVEI